MYQRAQPVGDIHSHRRQSGVQAFSAIRQEYLLMTNGLLESDLQVQKLEVACRTPRDGKRKILERRVKGCHLMCSERVRFTAVQMYITRKRTPFS
jgi:hypothetical protein